MKNPVNKFKERLQTGEQQLGIWMTIAGPSSAELLANCGYDWVLIDTEHSTITLSDVLPSLQAIAAYETVSPVVRVLENNDAMIKKLLDFGAQTLMVPYVQSADEARAAVAAMRYAPRGVRGMAGTSRATRYGSVENYATTAEAELCLIVQIETVTALAQLEEIAAVDGVDAVFVGPADLSASMGLPGQLDHPDVKAAVADAIARLGAIGKPSGIVSVDPDYLRECIEMGTRFTAVGIDMVLLVNAAKARVAEFR